MNDYQSGAYFISKRSSRRAVRYRKRRPRRAAGVLIAVLLLLTAGICLLVVFLPELTVGASAAPSFKGRTYYFLATAEVTDRTEALTAAQYTSERGGAGYVYNNGSYHIVAAVYDREADAKTLVSVNADSHYFSVTLPAATLDSGDKRLLDYLTGEWYNTVATAATELDRGNITEAAAENAVAKACRKLAALAEKAEMSGLKRAIVAASEYKSVPSRTVLSYIRYIQTDVIVAASLALG